MFEEIIKKNIKNVKFCSVINYKGSRVVKVHIKNSTGGMDKITYNIEGHLTYKEWGFIIKDLQEKGYEKESQGDIPKIVGK